MSLLPLYCSCFLPCVYSELKVNSLIDIINFNLMQLTGVTDADREALVLLVKAAKIMDEIFNLQVVCVYVYKQKVLTTHVYDCNISKCMNMVIMLSGILHY